MSGLGGRAGDRPAAQPWQRNEGEPAPWRFATILLAPDRAWLRARIETRFDAMLKQGVLAEVRAVFDRQPDPRGRPEGARRARAVRPLPGRAQRSTSAPIRASITPPICQTPDDVVPASADTRLVMTRRRLKLESAEKFWTKSGSETLLLSSYRPLCSAPPQNPRFAAHLSERRPRVMKPEESATTGADLLVESPDRRGSRGRLRLSGGAVLPIYDSLFKQNRLRHILVRHEQAPCMPPRAMRARPARVGVGAR
jgi:hypothetical protein